MLGEGGLAALWRGFGNVSTDSLTPRGLKEASMLLSKFPLRIANHTPVGEIVKQLAESGKAEGLGSKKKWHLESIR